MNIQTSYQRNIIDSKFCRLIKSRNDLQINRIGYVKNLQRGRIVISLESDFILNPEVNAFIHGNTLVIESLRTLDIEKPFKTHFIDNELRSNYDKDIFNIGFSEVQLNRDFRYSVLSYQKINPGQLKVVLSFHPLKRKP